MKIVDRKTFLALPAETLFSKYEPCIFGDLTIKGENAGSNDFLTQQIVNAVSCHDSGEFGDILHSAVETGDSFSMDLDCQGRDGLFDDGQLFAIWEPADIAMLIERLRLIVGPNVLFCGGP